MVYRNTAVCISVIGKTDIQPILNHIFLQYFDMRGTAATIDVGSVRIIIDHISLCTKCVKYTFCDCRRTSVRTIQSDFNIFEVTARNRNQITDITVTSGSIIHGTSDIFACCIWKIFDLAIQICFDSCLYFCFDLLSVTVQKLDSIIVKWIVTCRDHNSAVKILCANRVGNTRCCRYMKQICICSGSRQSGNQCILKHIAAASGILADYDPGLMFSAIVPADISANFESMIYC